MPEKAWLECLACAARVDVGPMFYGCPLCAAKGKPAPLEVNYTWQATNPNLKSERTSGLWRWSSLLPPVREDSRMSLGEGQTPLIPITCIAKGVNLLLKNVTGSEVGKHCGQF